MHDMEMHALHEVIDLIDEEIEKAEEHLDLALELGHAHHDYGMHMKHAEESLKDADEWMTHKHGHMAKLKDSPHDHHKACHHAWHHKHPHLQEEIDELKWRLHSYKQGHSNMPTTKSTW